MDIKQLQKMQNDLRTRYSRVQEELAEQRIEASSGGGMVTAVVSGSLELQSVKIKPEAVDPDDLEMLEDLVVAAVSQALEQARAIQDEEMSKVTGGMHMPGLF